MKLVHALHDVAAYHQVAGWDTHDVGNNNTTPLGKASFPESWVRGNIAQKAITSVAEPLYFDTGPANIKVQSAAAVMGLTPSGVFGKSFPH